jgi:hypothetical protein
MPETRHVPAPGARPRRQGRLIQEVTFAAEPGAPAESAGFLLRWETSRGAADLETPDGRLAGFLVADGRDGRGSRLFAAYRPSPGHVRASDLLTRHGTVEQGLTAILGTPPSPHTRYATRDPVVRFVKTHTTAADGNVFRQYRGPGGRLVEIKMRHGYRGPMLRTQREAAAEARKQLGLTSAAAARDPEPEQDRL